MAVERLDLRKYHDCAQRQPSQNPAERDTSDPAGWNSEIEEAAAIVHNVLLLHSRDYSIRAIAEDLAIHRSRVERIIAKWRNSSPVTQAS